MRTVDKVFSEGFEGIPWRIDHDCGAVVISINDAKCGPWRVGWVVRWTSLITFYASIPCGFQTVMCVHPIR